LIPLGLLAAVGTVELIRWLHSRAPRAAVCATGAIGLWVLMSHAIYVHRFFGRFEDEVGKYWQRHVDVKAACEWLRPRLDSMDAVYLTHDMLPFPHVLALVYLQYDPHKWFAETREYETCPPTLQAEVVCSRFGKVRIMYRPAEASAELSEMENDRLVQRVGLILRPQQAQRARLPAGEVRQGGVVWLYLYDLEI
jgi:hypothetical protein